MFTVGGGIHCGLGAPLARLEAQLAFPVLLSRYPDLRLVDGAQRRDSLTLRGYDEAERRPCRYVSRDTW